MTSLVASTYLDQFGITYVFHLRDQLIPVIGQLWQMISARRYLSYKLECSTGISTSEKNRKTLRENHDFSVVFKTANQLLTYYLLYSAP